MIDDDDDDDDDVDDGSDGSDDDNYGEVEVWPYCQKCAKRRAFAFCSSRYKSFHLMMSPLHSAFLGGMGTLSHYICCFWDMQYQETSKLIMGGVADTWYILKIDIAILNLHALSIWKFPVYYCYMVICPLYRNLTPVKGDVNDFYLCYSREVARHQ